MLDIMWISYSCFCHKLNVWKFVINVWELLVDGIEGVIRKISCLMAGSHLKQYWPSEKNSEGKLILPKKKIGETNYKEERKTWQIGSKMNPLLRGFVRGQGYDL